MRPVAQADDLVVEPVEAQLQPIRGKAEGRIGVLPDVLLEPVAEGQSSSPARRSA
ncbi:MAG: hypothetical protein ACXWKB_04055 [Methyloceanibacter sp.]